MFHYDFSNRQNRFIRPQDAPPGYLSHIRHTAQNDPFYPLWHIAPTSGLLNDPCGLFQKDGVHYIFHQWFPLGPVHGLKHWRLVTTDDFIHYRDHGAALEPDLPFDDHGCFTGTAFRGDRGVEFFYTGVQGEEMVPCVAHAQLQDDSIVDRRVIIPWDSAVSTVNFRDPCVFEKNGDRYLLLGAEHPTHRGCLLLYQETDGNGFSLLGPLRMGDFDFGYMLECPNYFETEGSGVLFFSPMGLKSDNRYDFKNVFSVVYAKGEKIDCQNRSFSFQRYYEMDKGFDFYAPQTYRDEQGRQIMFGWLGNSKSVYPTDSSHWAHMLTVPRQITWAGDRMIQAPLEELSKLRGQCRTITEDCKIPLAGVSFDLDCAADADFFFEIGNDAGEKITFTASEREFCLDRSNMTCLYAEAFGTKRYALRLTGKQNIRILADRSSIEIFADSGQTVFTSRFFLCAPSYLQLGGMTGAVYDMEPIQISGTN